ncbi:MAG TPA: AAA family ATPase [Nostocaceae cyanobacterium]|nr:AAA family ATPase [Nostocaceae cyanobacterium]
MRIKQISVTGLFGMFDHVIPLNMEDRITIIYGLNGIGKTAILRLLNGFFNSRYSELRSIPFKDFEIDFDNGNHIRVSKNFKQNLEEDIGDKRQYYLTFFFRKDVKSKVQSFTLNKLDSKVIPDFPVGMLDAIIPRLERASATKWRYLPTGELLSFEDVVERFSNFLPEGLRFQKQPEWLENIQKVVSLRFIESQRLLNISKNNNSQTDHTRTSMKPSVNTYADELAKSIQIKLTEYGTLSQSLDRTFPVRVVQQQSSVDMTDEQLRQKLYELEEKRLDLINTGLLDKDENPNFQIQETINESTKKVLSVYIEDVEKKLSIFNDLAQRIEVLKKIINQRFSHKEINISKEKGFTFTCHNHSLSPDNLSSGEQHELIIFYELLFKVKPNSFILIDEPEISLHVEWQVQFLKDLQEITQIAGIDVLMATHSPDIINGQWDLTVELKGTQK